MRQVLIIFVLFLWRGAVGYASPTGDTLEFEPTASNFDDEEEEEMPSTHVPKLLSTSIAVEATVGEPVTFPCDVEDLGEYVLLWKREKNRILFAGDLRIIRDDRIRTDGSSLQITSVLPKDSGEYTCQVSTNPPEELSHTLDVLYPPSIRAKPKEAYVTAKEGETVTLMCETSGNPVPTITWKHAGRHYDSFDENSYVITNAQKNASGEYECIADNSIGEPASAVITLEIVSAPKVYPEPRSGVVVVKEGEPISIGCEATGEPTPVITWKKPNGERMMKMNDENKINIAEASKADAGSYECVANNSLGISTSAVIRVQVLFPPKVHMSHSRIHAQENTIVNITCIVEGEPDPTITWKKDDSQGIHSNEHHHLKMHGRSHMLIIHHIQEQDFGKYECMASNSLSTATGTTHLIGTPQVPLFISKPHSTQGRKYTVSWKISPETPVDEYSLMYRKKTDDDDDEWETKAVPAMPATNIDEENIFHTQMFQLDELQPATEYEAVVKARNKFGWSEQSDVLVFKTKSEEKHSENYSSSSTSLSLSLTSLLILIICSKYVH